MASLTATGIAHWDDVHHHRVERGHLRATWTNLGRAAGSVQLGLNRLQLRAGEIPTPAHQHGAEEEIFYVMDGSGLSWQDGATHEVRAGDCLVHTPGGAAHTLLAGDNGLDVLAFGMRVPAELCDLPRAGSGWLGPSWVATGGPDPWDREVEVGPPDFPPPGDRPATTVNLADVDERDARHQTVGRIQRDLGRAAGSTVTGVRHCHVLPGLLNAAPHCHSAEEEMFVVIGGSGELLLGDESIPVRAGHVISRPAGTGVAHALRAGEEGMDVLMYGTREPNDIAYYPRSNKVFFRGIKLIGRIERLDYWDGEE
jgi:uncharacterized cupin superfamily protein